MAGEVAALIELAKGVAAALGVVAAGSLLLSALSRLLRAAGG